MSENDYLTTKEVATLLRLKERKVYDLASEKSIPCTRATGKLLFPRGAVLRWLDEHSSGTPASVKTPLIAGSHDPLLEWAIRESRCGIATLFDGSVDGTQRIRNAEATVAALHVFDSDTHSWNIEHVSQNNAGGNCALVHFINRSRGIVFRPDIEITDFSGIQHHPVAMRQQGAGSQIILESMLVAQGIDITSLSAPVVARSELDAVLAVVEGQAACTLGLQSIAAQHQLGFLPLLDEPLDLLVDRRFWFEPEMQVFIEFCRSDVFSNKVETLTGYTNHHIFSVIHNL